MIMIRKHLEEMWKYHDIANLKAVEAYFAIDTEKRLQKRIGKDILRIF